MAKKEQKERNQIKRNLWPINPVTKVKESRKVYNRKRLNHKSDDEA